MQAEPSAFIPRPSLTPATSVPSHGSACSRHTQAFRRARARAFRDESLTHRSGSRVVRPEPRTNGNLRRSLGSTPVCYGRGAARARVLQRGHRGSGAWLERRDPHSGDRGLVSVLEAGNGAVASHGLSRALGDECTEVLVVALLRAESGECDVVARPSCQTIGCALHDGVPIRTPRAIAGRAP